MQDFPETGGAILTGGSGGIGRAIALRLAQDSVRSAITFNQNRDVADAAAVGAADASATARAYQADLRNEAALSPRLSNDR